MNPTLVPQSQRMGFLPSVFGVPNCVRIESRVFHYASEMIEGYKGGFWDFVRVGETGYMRPNINAIDPKAIIGEKVMIHPSDISYWRGLLSLDAAGLAITVLATNHLWAMRPNDPTLPIAWGQLMELASEHPEHAALNGLLD